MRVVAEAAAFTPTAATLLILKGRLDSHAQGVCTHPFVGSGPIGDQKPGFLVARLRASAQPDFKGMLFPEQDLSIPVLPYLLHQGLALLPIVRAVAKLPAEPLLMFDA
jgi:hypothetical protein